MVDLIIVAVVLLVFGGASTYIRKAKKRGQTCVGCPHAKTCGSKCCCHH